jgi:hypothetical protein
LDLLFALIKKCYKKYTGKFLAGTISFFFLIDSAIFSAPTKKAWVTGPMKSPHNSAEWAGKLAPIATMGLATVI